MSEITAMNDKIESAKVHSQDEKSDHASGEQNKYKKVHANDIDDVDIEISGELDGFDLIEGVEGVNIIDGVDIIEGVDLPESAIAFEESDEGIGLWIYITSFLLIVMILALIFSQYRENQRTFVENRHKTIIGGLNEFIRDAEQSALIILASGAGSISNYRAVESKDSSSMGGLQINNGMSGNAISNTIAEKNVIESNATPDNNKQDGKSIKVTNIFNELNSTKAKIGEYIAAIQFGDSKTNTPPISSEYNEYIDSLTKKWKITEPEFEILVSNRGVADTIYEEASKVNALTPLMLVKTEDIVQMLIDSKSDLNQVNIASRLRFLTQRIKASLNEFIAGAPGWEVAATKFGRDVKLFGQINTGISRSSKKSFEKELEEISVLYARLSGSADTVMKNAGDYFSLRTSAQALLAGAQEMLVYVERLSKRLGSKDVSLIERTFPWVFGGLALVCLGFLVSVYIRQTKMRMSSNVLRTRAAEDAVIKLLDEMGDLAEGDLTVEAEVTNEVTGAIADSINYAISEMRELVRSIRIASDEVGVETSSTQQVITQLLSTNSIQSANIAKAASDVTKLSETMASMNELTTQSSERAKTSSDVAHRGADSVRKTINGMNITRDHIQETSKRLKRLGESSQQINDIVSLIQDVSEQTNVLSLNASIQAAMAGEAGRGFAVVAEEVQRLADRSAKASKEITGLVMTIQQDTNNAIASMESTTQEVVAGAQLVDKAGVALDELEQISLGLLETAIQVAEDADKESLNAREIAHKMRQIRDVTEESDASVAQVAEAIDRLNSVTRQLNQSVSGFKLPPAY